MSSAHRRTAVLAAAVALVAATSGCAAAARGLLDLDTVATVHDVVDPASGARPAPGTREAVVDGTGRSGLRLRDEPGGRRITVLAEGTVVQWSCRRTGPTAEGPRGTTDLWARVTSADGDTGFASGAYLRGREDVSALPTCPP